MSAPASRPLVSVVLVHYNGRRFLPACLAALAAQTYPPHLTEVILVDNASADGSADAVARDYPWVRLVRSSRNLGFAGGNNLGFAVARGEMVALLNNDTVADPRWLEMLVRALSRRPDFDVAASKLVFDGDPGVLNSAGMCLLPDGRGTDRGYGEPDDGRFEREEEVFGGCGAAVLLRREALDALGGFDERFFLYYEDADLAWRARHAGRRCVYVPSSVVRHVHCGSTGEGSPLFAFHVERNRVWAAWKNAEPMVALLAAVGLAARVGRALVRRRNVRAHLRALAGVLTRGWLLLGDRWAIRRPLSGPLAPGSAWAGGPEREGRRCA